MSSKHKAQKFPFFRPPDVPLSQPQMFPSSYLSGVSATRQMCIPGWGSPFSHFRFLFFKFATRNSLTTSCIPDLA